LCFHPEEELLLLHVQNEDKAEEEEEEQKKTKRRMLEPAGPWRKKKNVLTSPSCAHVLLLTPAPPQYSALT
jgi:hypothetical protein